MEWINVIQTLGFPIAAVCACGFFIYKLVNRDKDEAKHREDRLMEVNSESAKALDKVADTITDTNAINRELSETNKTLVDKIENKLNKLDGIDDNVNKILTKLNT